MFVTPDSSASTKAELYQQLAAQLRSLTDDETDPIANMANCAAGIKNSFAKYPTATIEYLSADLTRFVAGGTSTSGIFLSTDAPYGTAFSINGNPPPPPEIGGLVNGKVTIVEVEKIVEIGSLDPDQIHLPGIFVHRIVLNAKPEKRIEQRTVRKRGT
jgi:hypothetical protein